MTRLLIVTTVPSTLRAFLLPFARHYRALGWQVDAAAAGIGECATCAREFDACHELPLSRNPLDVATIWRAPGEIRALVERGAYDIVHVHTPVAAFLVRFALRRRGSRPRVVYTAHGFHFHRNGSALKNTVFRALEGMAAPWGDALVTIVREDYDAARAAGFRTRIEYMPGIGIDTAAWSPSRVDESAVAAVRKELGLTEEDVLFLMVAEFNPGKRHRDAIAAMSRINDRRIHLALAGEGKLHKLLQEEVAQAGLADRVHFLGFRRDIPVLMRASRAVLLPSEREGLPRCLMEALSLERAIIGADTRGIDLLCTEGRGILHRVGDVEALAAAMSRIGDDPALANEMGRRGRAEMIAAYDLRQIIALHDALYARLGIPVPASA